MIWPEFDKFLYSMIGALIGGSLVAWMSGYFSEKGKRKLLREELNDILEEARQEAYAKKRGEQIATKEDIDNVVEQVHRVTEVTETTKAQITGGLWEKQWQFAQKRDVYARLIDTLEMIEIKRSILVRRPEDEAVKAEARRGGLEAIEEFRRARVLAELLLTREAVDATHGVVRYVRHVFKPSPRPEAHLAAMKAIDQARRRIVEIGRAELGLSKPDNQGHESASTSSSKTA
jgi:hypothetical protein